MTIDMTKITEILNTAGHELRDYTAMTEADLAKLRIENRRRHKIGRARQVFLASKTEAFMETAARAWLNIVNADAKANGIH